MANSIINKAWAGRLLAEASEEKYREAKSWENLGAFSKDGTCV
jgi:hypothetical protein